MNLLEQLYEAIREVNYVLALARHQNGGMREDDIKSANTVYLGDEEYFGLMKAGHVAQLVPTDVGTVCGLQIVRVRLVSWLQVTYKEPAQ